MSAATPRPTSQKSRFAGMSVYLERRVLLFVIFGAASGYPLGLTGDTLRVWLTEAGVSWAEIGAFVAVAAPYSLKFLWSPAMDHIPIPLLTRFLGRRRSWILVCQIGLIAAVYALGQSDPATNLRATALLALSVAIISASQDIVIDAFRIEKLEERQLAAGTAVHVNSYLIGMRLISGALALWLADDFGWSMAYTVMAGIMVVAIITTLLVREPARQDSDEAHALRA